MADVTIYRCSTCESIRGYANQLATSLQNDPDIENVHIVDGARGEVTVRVGDRMISAKDGDSFRTPEEILDEIHSSESAMAG